MHGTAGPEMNGPDEPTLPHGYPDASAGIWIRYEDIEFAGAPIRFTVNHGDRIVQIWEMVDGHPVRWVGNVFRVEAEPPALYLNHSYEVRLSRTQRDELARSGVKFFKS